MNNMADIEYIQLHNNGKPADNQTHPNLIITSKDILNSIQYWKRYIFIGSDKWAFESEKANKLS